VSNDPSGSTRAHVGHLFVAPVGSAAATRSRGSAVAPLPGAAGLDERGDLPLEVGEGPARAQGESAPAVF
jgi:hypothetical protein